MKNFLKSYTENKNNILEYFGYNKDYFIKNIEDYNWRVKNADGMYILTYWREGERLNECIIVKKNNTPLITRNGDYTMIIGVECVKIALVLKNNMEV